MIVDRHWIVEKCLWNVRCIVYMYMYTYNVGVASAHIQYCMRVLLAARCSWWARWSNWSACSTRNGWSPRWLCWYVTLRYSTLVLSRYLLLYCCIELSSVQVKCFYMLHKQYTSYQKLTCKLHKMNSLDERKT